MIGQPNHCHGIETLSVEEQQVLVTDSIIEIKDGQNGIEPLSPSTFNYLPRIN